MENFKSKNDKLPKTIVKRRRSGEVVRLENGQIIDQSKSKTPKISKENDLIEFADNIIEEASDFLAKENRKQISPENKKAVRNLARRLK